MTMQAGVLFLDGLWMPQWLSWWSVYLRHMLTCIASCFVLSVDSKFRILLQIPVDEQKGDLDFWRLFGFLLWSTCSHPVFPYQFNLNLTQSLAVHFNTLLNTLLHIFCCSQSAARSFPRQETAERVTLSGTMTPFDRSATPSTMVAVQEMRTDLTLSSPVEKFAVG